MHCVRCNFRRILFGELFRWPKDLFDIVARLRRRLAIRFPVETWNVGHLFCPRGSLLQHFSVPLLFDLRQALGKHLPCFVHTLFDDAVLRLQMGWHFFKDFFGNTAAFVDRLNDVDVHDDQKVDATFMTLGRSLGPTVGQNR